MTGHGGYLPQYDRMSDTKKLEWFMELEPELIIDPTKRQELKINQLEEEKTELNDVKAKLDNALVKPTQKEPKEKEIDAAIARQEDIQKLQQQNYADIKKELEEIKKQQTNQKSSERPIEFCCAADCSIIHTKEQCTNCGSKIRRIYNSNTIN